MKVGLQAQKLEDAIEVLRKAFVACLRNGERLLVDCGKGGIDFTNKYNNPEIFDTHIFFDFVEGQKEENYMKIVKPEENHGIGGINPGFGYVPYHTFSLTFCSEAKDQSEIDIWGANMPH